ncbi:MAG: thioredoxin family protein [Candidatus Cloacimonetes bacterium]|nr:thioredoxin family protein [Candidatus Cloacimonadota bacterium]
MRQNVILVLFFAMLALGLSAQSPSITITVEPSGVEAGGEGVLHVLYSVPAGMHMQKQEDYLYVEVDAPEGIVFGPAVYPEAEVDEWGFEVYHHDFTLTLPFTVASTVQAGTHEIPVTVAWQICEEATCFPPDEAVHTATVDVTGGGSGGSVEEALNTAMFLLERSADGYGSIGGDSGGGSKVWNIIKYLLMAFVGGVILNIMPCVLPVLSIKAMHLVSQSQHDRREIMKGSFAYTGGILVSFALMAGVVITLKSMGIGAGWGFQMQNATFVIAFSSLIFVFSLSLFDVFIISAPGMSMANKASSKGGHSGSFFSGVFAVLLATPCTAPLLAPALGFAFTQPPGVILPFFLLIGLGLALPFILLAFWPGVIQKLPKPGEWMNVFREAMAFLLLGTALWLLTIAYALLGGANFLRVLWFMLFLSMAAWIYGRFARPHHGKVQQWIALLVAIGVIVGSAFWLLRFDENTDAGHIPQGWQEFSPELVQQHRDDGKAVFVDFGAEWCLTCKTNETAVLFTDDIENALSEHGVEMVKADNTRKDPVIAEWLKRYDRAGVPLYLLYYPGQSEPFVFSEILTKGDIHAALEPLK